MEARSLFYRNYKWAQNPIPIIKAPPLLGWAELENAYAELEAQRDSLQLEVGWAQGPEGPSCEVFYV